MVFVFFFDDAMPRVYCSCSRGSISPPIILSILEGGEVADSTISKIV